MLPRRREPTWDNRLKGVDIIIYLIKHTKSAGNCMNKFVFYIVSFLKHLINYTEKKSARDINESITTRGAKDKTMIELLKREKSIEKTKEGR